MKQQLFPIFDPITGEYIGYKPRELVHIDGDWHRGVQANIIRKNARGTFDILIQQRSSHVDIGKNNYDQSLATQMIYADNLQEEQTLKRGLHDELGITNYIMTKLPYPIRIVKTYHEDINKLNREFISLFFVLIDQRQAVRIKCNKIEKLEWMEWREFLQFYAIRKNSFTKTAQFYFDTPEILQAMRHESLNLLYSQNLPNIITKNNSLLHIHYYDVVKKTFAHKEHEIEKISHVLKTTKEELHTFFQSNLHQKYYAS